MDATAPTDKKHLNLEELEFGYFSDRLTIMIL